MAIKIKTISMVQFPPPKSQKIFFMWLRQLKKSRKSRQNAICGIFYAIINVIW